jgi:hypothetical protein
MESKELMEKMDRSASEATTPNSLGGYRTRRQIESFR